jgi:hypothetical protein
VSGELRLLAVKCSEIYRIFSPDFEIKKLSYCMSFRIEEIPADQAHLSKKEKLVPVVHYQVSMTDLLLLGRR